MSPQAPNHGQQEMHRAVRQRRSREERGRKEGERPLWLNLSMIGSLGWLIVIPTLIGVFVGRWLDRSLDTGITFSAALIVAGIAVGWYFAWQRIKKD